MYSHLTRSAFLLALMVVFQSIRLVVPVPPFLSMFVIGSAVNACLLLAVEMISWQAALVLAIAAPVVAALQQVLPSPVFIIPVAAANLIYVFLYAMLLKTNRWLAVGGAALFKVLGLYLMISLVLQFVQLPEKLAAVLKMMFSYPQFITGVLGGIVCYLLTRKLGKTKK
ncbi:hypothetical protein SPFL3102_00573 [Sporomusaceae bacterium FL31]|nr:hypothetical protein SPFL3101_01378 [Sporomusaceae bacterium FL31]GCE32777.1 hypothetical protein SPFL3102_00573 [Sporomusaceae bacterium]